MKAKEQFGDHEPDQTVTSALKFARLPPPSDSDLRNHTNGHSTPGGEKFDWRKVQINADELQRKVITHPPYVVPKYMPHGLTMVGGRPKAGKTTLVMQIGFAVAADSGSALGETIAVHGDVHFIGLEDTETRYQRRFGVMFPDEGWPQRLHLYLAWPTMRQGGLAALSELVDAYPATQLIVIDSWPLFRGESGSMGYNKDYMDAHELAEWTRRHNTNVLITSHTTKTKNQIDGEEIDFIQDTTGITAAMDTILIMRRKEGVMTMYRKGRDLDDTDPVKLQDDPDHLIWLPNPSLIPPRTRESILATLWASETAMSPAGIARVQNISRDAVKQQMYRLADEGLVKLTQRGYWELTDAGGEAMSNGFGLF